MDLPRPLPYLVVIVVQSKLFVDDSERSLGGVPLQVQILHFALWAAFRDCLKLR